jgi:hypothetical protein
MTSLLTSNFDLSNCSFAGERVSDGPLFVKSGAKTFAQGKTGFGIAPNERASGNNV